MAKHSRLVIKENRRQSLRSMVFVAASFVLVIAAHSASVTLVPNKDATLLGISPSNSIGGQGVLLAGVTQNGTLNRALLKFDLAGALLPGSKVINANLTVTVSAQSGERPTDGIYGLHRLLVSWGEGTNATASSIGLGVPAHQGDATWMHRFFATNNWASPGGGSGFDYVDSSSSSCYIDNVGAFNFDVTGDLIADVQLWLDHPEANFGWMLRDDNEEFSSAGFTARRFLSRENGDPNLAPQLNITFLPPPPISVQRSTNGTVQFSFNAEPGGIYALEATAAFGATNTWFTVTNFGYITQPSTLTWIGPVTNTSRFFRVRAQ